MLTRRQWADEPDLLETVAEALEGGDVPVVVSGSELSPSRDAGFLRVEHDGRIFYLEAWELVT